MRTKLSKIQRSLAILMGPAVEIQAIKLADVSRLIRESFEIRRRRAARLVRSVNTLSDYAVRREMVCWCAGATYCVAGTSSPCVQPRARARCPCHEGGFVRAKLFYFSGGPKFGEFRPISCLQVVGWPEVRERRWAVIRWVSARGWAEMHFAWDKSQWSVVRCSWSVVGSVDQLRGDDN
jgi:hypothetical protein